MQNSENQPAEQCSTCGNKVKIKRSYVKIFFACVGFVKFAVNFHAFIDKYGKKIASFFDIDL